MILIKFKLFDILYTNKFQGKPVKIIPLKNSVIPNKNENVKNALTIFFGLKKQNKTETSE